MQSLILDIEVMNDGFTFPRAEKDDEIALIGIKYLPSQVNKILINSQFLS